MVSFFNLLKKKLRVLYIEESGRHRSPPAHGEKFGALDSKECAGAPGSERAPLLFVESLLPLDNMYERHKRRYSLCDISKVDRAVDVVLLKVRSHAGWTSELSGSLLSPGAGSLAACLPWERG